jgi:hypothetical protein
VNYTREPIIETVITPNEGCNLIVRNSKVGGQEEYLVDAIEVVSFGNALFFRSIERPKSFLVPVNDYEVIELKEATMVLKSVSIERAIKIGGGKETPEEGKISDRKKERRKSRRRRLAERIEGERRHEEVAPSPEAPQEAREGVMPPPPPPPRRMIPPPPILIKEKLKVKETVEENSFERKGFPEEGEKKMEDFLPPPVDKE